MNIKYKLFSEIDDNQIKTRCLEIAEIYSTLQKMCLEGKIPGYHDAFLGLAGMDLIEIVFFHDNRHTDTDDGYLKTKGTFVEEEHHREGAALEMRLALNKWAKEKGYIGIRTTPLNSKMIGLMEKLAEIDIENKYDIHTGEIAKCTITF